MLWSMPGEASQTVTKRLLTLRKMMLVFGGTAKTFFYQQELINRKVVVFQHENARPHISLVTVRTEGAWQGRSEVTTI